MESLFVIGLSVILSCSPLRNLGIVNLLIKVYGG